MYHVSAQGVDERMINIHYYYYQKNACFVVIHRFLNDFFFFFFFFLELPRPSHLKCRIRWFVQE